MARFTINNIPAPIDFTCNNDLQKRTIQNCKNLMMCRMGEVPYDRRRGLNPAVYDMTMTELNEQLMPEIDRVLRWEPDANAISASAYRNENGETIITVTVEIRA